MYMFNANTVITAHSNMKVDNNSFHMELYVITIILHD